MNKIITGKTIVISLFFLISIGQATEDLETSDPDVLTSSANSTTPSPIEEALLLDLQTSITTATVDQTYIDAKFVYAVRHLYITVVKYLLSHDIPRALRPTEELVDNILLEIDDLSADDLKVYSEMFYRARPPIEQGWQQEPAEGDDTVDKADQEPMPHVDEDYVHVMS